MHFRMQNDLITLNKMLRKNILIVICSCSFLIAQAQLSQADNDTLTKHLNILSQGWVDNSVGKANEILSKTDYTWQDWRTFFSSYFRSYPLTADLRNYLGYPTIFWFDNSVHFKLQQAIKFSSIEQLDSIFSIARLGQVLATNSVLKEEIINFSEFFDVITYPSTQHCQIHL